MALTEFKMELTEEKAPEYLKLRCKRSLGSVPLRWPFEGSLLFKETGKIPAMIVMMTWQIPKKVALRVHLECHHGIGAPSPCVVWLLGST